MLPYSIEKQYVIRVYILVFATLLINPLLSKFVPNTTILRSMEMLCYISIFIYEFKLYRANCLRHFCSYEKILYVLLLFISIYIVIRGSDRGEIQIIRFMETSWRAKDRRTGYQGG